MTDTVLAVVLESLAGPGRSFEEADLNFAGLYAVYGGPQIWRELALGDPPDEHGHNRKL